MVAVAARLILGGILAGASLAKLASPGSSRAAMATFGFEGRRSQAVSWALVIVAELALAAGVIAGSDTAAVLAAALMGLFVATMVGAILRGRVGAPCACFGVRSTVGWPAVARNGLLAAAFAALPLLPDEDLSTDQWLGLGLGIALLACVALAIAVLALAREVGILRLRLGPAGALEIPDEGPQLGSRSELVDRFSPEPEAELALAVFVSEGCHVCTALEPSIRVLARDPAIAVETFEERADAAAWRALEIPGSPFAVALDLEGMVLAKGTFNNLAQLESVLAAAQRRHAERRLAGAFGV